MASLSDWIKDQTADYGQLKEAYPNAMKFGSALKKGISQLVPTQEDLNSPQKMGEWGLSAALNAPMGMMFVGPKSAGWDATKADEAEKLLNAGAEPAQVWKEHLIGRMPDKSLFSEIDDSNMTSVIPLNKWVNKKNGQLMAPNVSTAWDDAASQLTPQAPVRIKRLFEHEQLKKQYPYGFTKNYENQSIMDMPVFMHKKNSQFSGSLVDGELILHPYLQPMPAKSTTLHELQHAIQEREGWARGGNPNRFYTKFDNSSAMQALEKLKKENPLLASLEAKAKKSQDIDSPEIKDFELELIRLGWNPSKYPSKEITPMQQYQRLTGEAQARATQDRMNMNMQQRRESYPLANDMLSDIPLDQLINKYNR